MRFTKARRSIASTASKRSKRRASECFTCRCSACRRFRSSPYCRWRKRSLRLRPGRALELLDEARRRFPDDAELLYLSGLAHFKRGDAEKALDPLVKSVQIDPRVRFGEPYLVAGDALRKLGRHDEAIDAYERFVDTNSSSIEGQVKLALAHHAAKDEGAATKALAEAFATWGQIPGYKRRKELGWWLDAWACRVVI